MSWNGSGVFQINTSGQPVVSGTVISATVFNTLTADIASGLSNCITKDGQQTVTANIPMGGYKFTNLGYGTSSTDSARIDNCNVLNMCEFRLTITSGNPVATGGSASTIYFTPYKGNRIALYDGSKWVMRTSAEITISVPNLSLPHDVFVYDNAGVPTIELTAWLSDLTRATALTFQDGVYVKSGAVTRRYVGSFRSFATLGGIVVDSYAVRSLWNYYNRVARPMRVYAASNSWNYTTDSWRQADNSIANQLDFMIGVDEDYAEAQVMVAASNSTGGSSTSMYCGIGLDSSGSIAAGSLTGFGQSSAASVLVPLTAAVRTLPGAGYHSFKWLERSTATGTTTWLGSNTIGVSGMHGVIMG